MNISLSVSGIDKLKERLAASGAAVRKSVAAEMYQFSEEVMAASKEVVPVDTGALMATGHVELPVEDGDVVTVTLGYGDTAVGYALYVHEDMSPTTKWTRPGSGPKYLEGPLKERQDSLPGRLLDAYKRGLKP
jgi:hypothetical protein